MAQSAVALSIGTCEKEKETERGEGKALTLLPHNEGI